MTAPLALLLVTHQHVARVDLNKGMSPTPKVATRQTDSLPDAVLQALMLDAGVPRQVYVLLDDVFTQTIALNVSQTAGLGPLEVERALAFEVEPLSGIVPFESALGYRMLDAKSGQRQFAIAQCPLQVRDTIQQTLRGQNVKLIGICHPRGLVERALPADESGLQSWLNEAGNAVATSAPACALIGAIELPTPTQSFVLVGAAVLLLVAGACYGHWNWMNGIKNQLTVESVKSREPEKQLAEVRKKTDAMRKEAQALKAANVKRSESRALLDHDLGRHRLALGTLVEQLARSQPDDAAIDVIETSGGQVTVRGVSLESKQADEWIARLSEALKPAGWVIQPLEKTALRRLENGGPFAFSLQASRAVAPKKVLSPAEQALSEVQR